MNIHVERKTKQAQELVDHSDNRLFITYYTDPFCCWSWGYHEILQRLREELADKLNVRYVMSVLYPLSSPIQAPLEMAKAWDISASFMNIPLRSSIWQKKDPPVTSEHACLAVKTAGLQSVFAEQLCFHKMQEAVMMRGMNISRHSIITLLAEELADEYPEDFKLLKFIKDFSEEKARKQLDKDVHYRTRQGIEQLPTFHLSTLKGKKMILSGYKPYGVVRNSIRSMGL